VALAAPAGYLLLAFAYWGVRLLPHPGRFYVGTGTDPQIFIWSIGWWPHALAHGLDAVHTDAIWAPQGENLAWTTAVPGVALPFAPLTYLAGPIVSYNVAAILMPPLAAWTAFLLCRYLTRSIPASLVGGYLFGFSSFMVAQFRGHLHMTSVFLLPLIALVVIRYVDRDLDGRGLAIRLGPMLALQLGLSTENAFSFTLALALAIVLAFAVVPWARRRLLSLLAPLATAYAIGGVLAAPLLYYALKGFRSDYINNPQFFTTDLLNLVVPTPEILAGGRAARHVSQHFPGNDGERDAYLGIPVLAIVALYAVHRLRSAGGRLLLVCFVVAVIASFGAWFTVDGRHHGSMPWEHVGYLPLFDNVLPSRLMLFASLAAAIVVASWMATTRQRWLRFGLPALAIVSLVPNPASAAFRTAERVPPFFRSDDLQRCIHPREIVLTLPQAKPGNAMLWQAVSGYRFRLADGYVAPSPPASFYTSPAVARIANGEITWRDLRLFARAKGVTTVLVDARRSRRWRRLLTPLPRPHEVGGVLIYRFGDARRC
jgi:hypothetical protein